MSHHTRGALGKGMLLWFLGLPASVVVLMWAIGILK